MQIQSFAYMLTRPIKFDARYRSMLLVLPCHVLVGWFFLSRFITASLSYFYLKHCQNRGGHFTYKCSIRFLSVRVLLLMCEQVYTSMSYIYFIVNYILCARAFKIMFKLTV